MRRETLEDLDLVFERIGEGVDRLLRDLPLLLFAVLAIGAVGWTAAHGFWPQGFAGLVGAALSLWFWLRIRSDR